MPNIITGAPAQVRHQNIENKREWARKIYEDESDRQETMEAKMFAGLRKKVKAIREKWRNLKRFVQRRMIFNGHLKKIEKRFGEGFLSLFEFIRWLMLVNLAISVLIVVFVLLPQELYNFDVTYRDLNLNTSFNLEAYNYCQNNTNQTTDFSSTNVTDYQTNIVAAKCCSLKYQKILSDKIAVDGPSVTDFFLDLLQGTGKLEDSFLFYGYYNNRSTRDLFYEDQSSGELEERPDKHIYYMGLSFAFISIVSLLITAISMLCRMGSGIKSSIIRRLDSESTFKYCQTVFCSWNYKLQGEGTLKHENERYYRFLDTAIKQFNSNAGKKRLTGWARLWRVVKNTTIAVITLAMFPAGGYGFFRLNEFSKDFISDIQEKIEQFEYGNYLITLFQYLPLLTLRAFIFIFTLILYRAQNLEDYSKNTRFTWLLFKLGLTRIASLLFVIFTIGITLLRNQDDCGFQKIDFSNFTTFNLTGVNFIDSKTNILCYETYIGQEFYKLVIVDLLFQVLFFLKNFFGWMCSQGCKNGWMCSQGCKNSCLVAEFNLEETFLDVLSIQTVFWLSIYFTPFVGMFAFVYYLIKFYLTMISLRVFTKLPEKKEQIESKINNSFFVVLFINFLLVLLVYGLVFNTLRPSKSCGPFQIQITQGNYDQFTVLGELNNLSHRIFPVGLFTLIDFVFSNIFLWPFSFVMILVIWLLFTNAETYRQLADELRDIIENETKINSNMAKKVTDLEWKIQLHNSK